MTTQTMGTIARVGEPASAKADGPLLLYCPACGVDLLGGAKFCHRCGTSVAPDGRSAGLWNTRLLTVAGAAVAVLAIVAFVFMMVMDVDKETPGQAAQAPFVAAGQAASQPPDLSTMTPREAADRLFNRVMMANEQGNGDEAMRFAPMAIQAYDLLGTLDLDALYHVGRLQETIGDLEAAEAVIGDMRKTAPDHLLAILLEHDVAVQRGDEARAGEAAAAFLDAYDRELAQGRGEYGDHSASLEMFLAEARDEVKRQE